MWCCRTAKRKADVLYCCLMKRVIRYLESEETKKRILALIKENIVLYQGIDTEDRVHSFTGMVYNRFVKECVQNNQYVSLSDKTIQAVNEVYRRLVVNLRRLGRGPYDDAELVGIVADHRERLILALKNNEYEDTQEQLIIPCSEYSAEFQHKILRLGKIRLREPVIDIGCEEVYGLDQYAGADKNILCGNWHGFRFQPRAWGTVIAHMSFTNHLRRSLIHKDDMLEKNRAKYHEILRSLAGGGVFIYTPSVKAVEAALDTARYEVRYFNNIADEDLDTVHVYSLIKERS